MHDLLRASSTALLAPDCAPSAEVLARVAQTKLTTSSSGQHMPQIQVKASLLRVHGVRVCLNPNVTISNSNNGV
jgi:hypothetical protein